LRFYLTLVRIANQMRARRNSSTSVRSEKAAQPARASKAARTSRESGTRRQILDQAARLLRTNGYASTSLRDIAAATGMKAGSLYYHFDSKEALAEIVMSEGIELVRTAVQEALATQPDGSDPLDDVAVAIKAHLRALRDSGDYASANIRCFAHVPAEMRRRLRAVREGYEDDWRKLIARARAAGRLAAGVDDDALRYGLFGVMNWTLEWLRPGGPPADELAGMFFRIMFRGAAARR
jgi:TetR/AcrR family transcriptional regulator, cholesterol catabolism regulator